MGIILEEHAKKGDPMIMDKAKLKLELLRFFHDSPSGTFKVLSKSLFLTVGSFSLMITDVLHLKNYI